MYNTYFGSIFEQHLCHQLLYKKRGKFHRDQIANNAQEKLKKSAFEAVFSTYLMITQIESSEMV